VVGRKTKWVEERAELERDAEGQPVAGLGIVQDITLNKEAQDRIYRLNRIYAMISGTPESTGERIGMFLCETSGAGPELRDYFYSYRGAAAIRHLFRVACGLDSMILGEPQILGQVKSAYSLACDCQTTGPSINRLFHHAFRVGKLIRSNTSIGSGTVSASYAAVELARQIFGDLTGKSALLAGAGKTGELCVRRLMDSGVRKILIANRTPERAAGLAARLTGETAPFDRIPDLSVSVDIIITSVASREPIIRSDAIRPFLEMRDGSPLLFIDLGVPRNIETSVAELDGVRLCDIDDLENVILDNRDRRRLEAEKAEELIRSEVEDFYLRLSERAVAPVIRELHDRCEKVRLGEIERVRGRADDQTLALLDLVTRRIVRKILHNPTVAVRSSESGAIRERLLQSVQELFMRDVGSGEPGDQTTTE
jgi:glutamyl-tRNA reductase